ncbi:MAG: toprim domain-containing protein [Oleispira sp.]|nr:toprim domain-containing protein [Oleispira sp.]
MSDLTELKYKSTSLTSDTYEAHQPCPDCGGSDCLTVWDNGNTFCHSGCPPKSGKKTYTKEIKVVTKLTEVHKDHRGITKKTNEFYGITNGVDSSGDDVYRMYPYPSQPKYRYLPKDFSHNLGFKANELLGMDKFNAGSSQYLTICEGEEDVASAYQMLGSKFPVVGLPSAAISKKLLQNCYEYINSFKTIVVCTDADDAGRKAALKIAEVFPNKVYQVSMTKHKDPNGFLMAGDSSDFLFAWVNRTKYVPEFDVSTPEGYLKLFDETQDAEYIPTGIESYDEKHLGLFQGHFTIFTAPEGVGKTEWFRYLEYRLITHHPEIPFASCHLEETQLRSLLGLVSYKMEKDSTRKELITDDKEARRVITELTKNENVHMFSIGVDEDPMVLIDRIKYYSNICGCKYVFIEPIQDLAYQRHGTDTVEQFLTKLAILLSRTATETGVGIISIAHENDDGLIRDCRMIGKRASVVVKLSRDVTSTDNEERNTTTLTSVKNRPASFAGYAGQLFFDSDKFMIEEKL